MQNWNSRTMNDLLNGLSLVARFRNCLAVGIWFHSHVQNTGLLINRPPSLSFRKEMNTKKLLLGFVCNLSPVLCPGLAYPARFVRFSNLTKWKIKAGTPSFQVLQPFRLLNNAFVWSAINSLFSIKWLLHNFSEVITWKLDPPFI